MGFFDSDFLGGLFDFDGDGKTSWDEEFLAFKMFESSMKHDDDDSSGFSFFGSSSSSDKYEWRRFCVSGTEYNLDPGDYETEDEYLAAIDEVKQGWQDTHDMFNVCDLDPTNYETEEEYKNAICEVKQVWQYAHDIGNHCNLDPHDYESENEYIDAINEVKQGWQAAHDFGNRCNINPRNFESEDEYKDAIDRVKQAWQFAYDFGNECSLDPRDYKSENEYIAAINEVKQGWQDDHDFVNECNINPQDYETEDEYIAAVNKAKQELQEQDDESPTHCPSCDAGTAEGLSYGVYAGNFDSANKRRRKAAEDLTFWLRFDGDYKKEEKDRCKFILENADKIVAANYLTSDGSFLYAQAIKDNFTIPCTLPDEDEESELDFEDALRKIAKRDAPLSLEIWTWCLEQFTPYYQYAQNGEYHLGSYVISHLYNFPNSYTGQIVHHMADNPKFLELLISESRDFSSGTAKLVTTAIEEGLYSVADTLFKSELTKAKGYWKQVNELTRDTINLCTNLQEVETIEYFRDNLLPLVKAIPDGMIQDEISEWESRIAGHIERMEDSCEKYAYSRKNSWRATLPDGSQYHMNPCRYRTEQEYLDDLNKKKYGWREKYRGKESCGLNVDNFETREEYLAALAVGLKELKQQNGDDLSQASPPGNENTIYTYYGVLIPTADRPYAYLSQDTTIQLGDTVTVPVGADNNKQTGIVVSITHCTQEGAPYPPDKTKMILGKTGT